MLDTLDLGGYRNDDSILSLVPSNRKRVEKTSKRFGGDIIKVLQKLIPGIQGTGPSVSYQEYFAEALTNEVLQTVLNKKNFDVIITPLKPVMNQIRR